MTKCASTHLIDHLVILFNLVLDSGHFPEILDKSYLIPLFKKGDSSDPNNYRGIAIGSCLAKVFISIVNNRITQYMETNNLIDNAQCGFRKDHCTTDNIFILHTLINKCKNTKKKLFACFVDFPKAFDTVWREGLHYKLQLYNLTGKVFSVIENMYKNVSYILNTARGSTNPIPSNIGVKQGCACSPTLFNIYLNDLGSYLPNDAAPLLADVKISHLLFADDLILLSSTKIGL
jgi:hypothetical protein